MFITITVHPLYHISEKAFSSLFKDKIKLNCIDRVICRPCFNQSTGAMAMTIILLIACYLIPSALILFMNYQIIIYLKKAQTVRKDYIMKAPPAPRAIVRVNNCFKLDNNGLGFPRKSIPSADFEISKNSSPQKTTRKLNQTIFQVQAMI